MSKKNEMLNLILERISEHGNAEKISELCLDEIIIERFNPELNKMIEKCQNVIHLSVASCGLAELRPFPKMRKLQYLDLQNNLFTDNDLIDLESQIQSLEGLNISGNSISKIESLIQFVNRLCVKELNIFQTPLLETFPKCIERLFESCKTLQCIDWEDKKGKQVNQYDRQSSSSDNESPSSQKQYSQGESNEQSISMQSVKKVKVQ